MIITGLGNSAHLLCSLFVYKSINLAIEKELKMYDKIYNTIIEWITITLIKVMHGEEESITKRFAFWTVAIRTDTFEGFLIEIYRNDR